MITPDQKLLRSKLLGSSDSPAVLGLDPYRSAADVFLEKTGRVDPFAGNENTDRGNLLEGAVLDWAETQLNEKFQRNVFVHIEGDLCANLDAAFSKGVVEAKTSVLSENWGDDGTDQIPENVMAQVHHQFAVTGYEFGYVAVLLPVFRRFDFRLYPIECDRKLRDFVAEQGIAFMDKYVRRDTPPPNVIASMDVLKRMKRVPKKVVPIAADLACAYLKSKAAVDSARDQADELYRQIVASLGDAEGAEYDGGAFTFLETERKGYAVAESTYRTLRHKAAK